MPRSRAAQDAAVPVGRTLYRGPGFREVAAEYTAAEQRALFHDTAAQQYGIAA